MNLSLRLRLALLALIPFGCFVFTGLFLLNEQRDDFNVMKDEIYNTSSKVDTLVLNADRDMYQTYLAYLNVESGTLDPAGVKAAQEDMAENIKQIHERIAEAQSILYAKKIQNMAYGESARTLDQLLIEFKANFNFWSEGAVRAVADGKNVYTNANIDKTFNKSRTGLGEIAQNINEHSQITMKKIEDNLQNIQLIVFYSMLGLVVVMGVLVYFTIRKIMRTIQSVVSKTKRVAEGDLTVLLDEKYDKDELGLISKAVDHMIEAMKQLISGIADNTSEVTQASIQLSSASKESAAAAEHVALNIQEVANGSEVQARGAEETNKAIEEMTVGIQRIAENTNTIADHSAATSSQAEQGQEALERLINQMTEVKSVISKLSDTIITLENRSQQIGAIAVNITAFANQTNILSLNASIEAARAGEQGRGFAVVAGEIRKLAVHSLESADGINKLVEMTQSEISGASMFMTQTVQEVDRGGVQVQELSRNLDVIVSAIMQMTEQLHETSAITEQMSASSEQVSASMEQSASTAALNLDKTESVAAATEEQLALMDNISSAAVHLNEIVSELNRSISHFKVR